MLGRVIVSGVDSALARGGVLGDLVLVHTLEWSVNTLYIGLARVALFQVSRLTG